MSRLTPKEWENPYHEIWLNLGYMHTTDERFRHFLSQSLRKLAHYEDLEEQGRLVVLPCKVGDTVYLVSNKCIEDSCPEGMAWECDECDYEEQFLVAERKFELNMIPKIGELYLLTEEEAEAKLAEVKGE